MQHSTTRLSSAGENPTLDVESGKIPRSRRKSRVRGTSLRLLEHLDVGGADDDTALAAIKTVDGVIARAPAMQLQCIRRFTEHRFADDHYAAGEIAMELTWTRRHTQNQVALAHQLTQNLPKTLARMRAGEINRDKASALAELTETLDCDARRQVEEKVLAKAGNRSTRWLRETARREILKVDPTAAECRRAERKRERRMEKYPSDDGMSWLSFYLPAEKAEAIYRRVNAIAKGAKTRQDPRSIDEVRADVAVGLLLGAASNVITRIEVRVDATTLMGLDDKPGTMTGYGPVSADHARELAREKNNDWYRLLTDPLTGMVGRLRPYPPSTDHPPTRDRQRQRPTRAAHATATYQQHNANSTTPPHTETHTAPPRTTAPAQPAPSTTNSKNSAGP